MFKNCYIGIKDINEIPIKEGDILKFEDYYKNKIKGIVKYNKRIAKFVVEPNNHYRYYDFSEVYEPIIIKENSENAYILNTIFNKEDFEYILNISLTDTEFNNLCKKLDDSELENVIWDYINDFINKEFYGDEK